MGVLESRHRASHPMEQEMANRLPRAALVPAGVICLIAILAAELAFSVRRQSQTFDEGCHIFAGYE